jgi:hypothetical protein
MFRKRKCVGLFALVAFAATGLAAAPVMAGSSNRGDRSDKRVVYRSSECAPRGRLSVSLGSYGGRESREHWSHDRGHSRHHRNDRWAHNRGRNECRR